MKPCFLTPASKAFSLPPKLALTILAICASTSFGVTESPSFSASSPISACWTSVSRIWVFSAAYCVDPAAGSVWP